MATNNYFLFFFLFVSLILISNAYNPSKPYDLVNKVCHEQTDVESEFCVAVFKSDKRSAFARGVRALAKIAVHVASKYVTRTRDKFVGLKTGPPGLLKSLRDCISAYDDAIRDFEMCFKEEDCELIGYDIHQAADGVAGCQRIADDNGAHGSFITRANNVTLGLMTLSESLANRMCANSRY